MLGEAEAIAGGRWFFVAAILVAAFLLPMRSGTFDGGGFCMPVLVSGTPILTRLKTGILFGLIFVIGYLNAYTDGIQERFADTVSGSMCQVSGVISEIKEGENSVQVFITAAKIEGKDKNGNTVVFQGNTKVITYVEAGETLSPGQQVVNFEETFSPGQQAVFSGRAALPEKASNPGAFDARTYYKSKQIFMTLVSAQIEEAGGRRRTVRGFLYQIKKKAAELMDAIFDEPDASVVKAMLLGEKSTMDADTKRMYQINGIAHILAISGLHIAILGMTLFRWLRKRIGSYWIAGFAAISLVFLYGIMTGLAGSTCRAVLMMMLLFVSKAAGRTTDMLTSAGIACMVMAFFNPYSLLDVEFQLSFSAVAGMGILYPALVSIFGKGGKIKQTVLIGSASYLATLPIVVYSYFQFPLYGIFLNLIVVPLLSMVLLFSILAVSCGIFSIQLAGAAAYPVKLILELYERMCQFFEQLPYSSVNVGHISADMVFVFYAALLLMLWIMIQMRAYADGRKQETVGRMQDKRCKKGRGRLAVGWLLVIFTGISAAVYEYKSLDREFVIAYLDVGQGDGILMRTKDGMHILIDGGSVFNQKVGEYVILPAVKYYGMAELDYVFVTHGDKDHISGICYLLETKHTGVRIKNLVFAKYGDAESLAELKYLAEKQGVNVLYMDAGDTLAEQKGEESLRLTCIYPGAESRFSDLNESSLMLLAEYEQFRFLFTGDAGFEAEKQLLSTEKLEKCDVLKAGHHGSKYATSQEFLQEVSPEYAVISCGRNNSYGHPADETVRRMSEAGIDIHCTKESGAVIVTIQNGKLKISDYLEY